MKPARLLLLALIAAAPAQPLQPRRDVVVTYTVQGPATELIPGGLPGPVTLFWDAAGQRVRVEAAGRNQVVLMDLRSRRGQVVDTNLRIALPLAIRGDALRPLTLQDARLTVRGQDRVAGLDCTVYTVAARGADSTICLTADGVPLGGAGEIEGRPGSFRATAVDYRRIPAGQFEVPQGYIALGGGSGGLGDLRGLGEALLGRQR